MFFFGVAQLAYQAEPPGTLPLFAPGAELSLEQKVQRRI